ncbi:hypothetical protein [Kineosporia succinea]|uniref:Lycopene cyclase domain-containing protein n=1 Tax=Kineosporia succinea TaxID=84632 RepID=A0ABT9PBA5_9ACTN|nr:hypothetical protein [Kineosporia succinea]MDP9829987.1 hypothetical protein [Kineosporia succinea]
MRQPAALPVAALAALGGLLHLLTLRSMPWWFAVMAVACLVCAVHLLRSRCRRALVMAAVMAVVMVVVHVGYLLVVTPSFAGTGHQHGAVLSDAALGGAGVVGAHPGHLSLLMLLPLLPELALLILAAPALRRTAPALTLRRP